MPKPKPHLVITSTPLAENSSCVGLCGEEIQKAHLLFAWDETGMGRLLIPPLGACRHCNNHLSDGHDKAYVYMAIESKEGQECAV